MRKETLKFGECVIKVIIIDNIIYLKTLHNYTDKAAIEMTKYLDKVISQISHKPIRVWDSSDLSSECFRLTTECVTIIVEWSQKIKKEKPGSQSFFIAPTPVIYGMSRMYEIQANDHEMEIMVVKSIDDLPHEILSKLPR